MSDRLSYDEIERLAAQIDRHGGFAWHNDDISIGVGDEEILLTGEDRVQLLTHLWRRASRRKAEEEGFSGYQNTTYNQGWNDCRRELKAAINESLQTVTERYS